MSRKVEFLVMLWMMALLLAGASLAAGNDLVVRANGEQLEGQWADESETVAVFKGIPFAAPPVGELRWRAPQPHKLRAGIQSAREFAPACMQGSHIVDWYADVARNFGSGPADTARPNGVSEDCLYLNVWTPNPVGNEKLPVMIWFHGGSNKGGWSYEPNYIGAKLAAKGVVVVTVTYRLGPFGFFSHPSLQATGNDQAVANFGWLDQLAALDWNHAHIAAFGGDPDNVTAIGESSGAGDLANMLGTEIATGVYHRAIAQSPAADLVKRRTLADERRNGEKLATELGIANDDRAIEKLRQQSAKQILAASERILPGHYFEVVIDDVTFRQAPLETLSREKDIGIDLLIGTNKDEWYMYYADDTDWGDVDLWLERNAPRSVEPLRAQFADETNPRRALDRLETAKEMLCPNRRAAARITAAGGRVWFYYFSRQRPGPGGDKLGAYHGTEIPYVFDSHDAWLPTDAVDRRLTDAVMDYWVQFARSGDPNVPGRPEWPQYRTDKPEVMELGDNIKPIPPVDTALCVWLGPA
jgi:para-nitrobenzyl esterase